MDAETEGTQQGCSANKCGDEIDEGIDMLLLKAVTVSQINLPIAAIDKDIDDLAITACEQIPPDTVDDEFMRLIERTRQRRELLNQKMGKTPEAVPRKRRSPFEEDRTGNVNSDLNQHTSDNADFSKRQCLRAEEIRVKPDTPAIPSIRSRLQYLSNQQSPRSGVAGEDNDTLAATPKPTPRKSLSAELDEKYHPVEQENTKPEMRKNRFAKLAQNINTWEDDLSHPVITKDEVIKPRWQPPKASSTTATVETSSSKKGPLWPPTAASVSPKKNFAPAIPQSVEKTNYKSPVRSTSRVEFNSSPKPFKRYDERNTHISPVKSPVTSKSSLTDEKDQQETSVAKEMNMKNDENPKPETKVADRPLSAHLATWEQKVSDTFKCEVGGTAKSGSAISTTVLQTPKQLCTPAKIVPSITDAEITEVQMRRKPRKSLEDEPTAHPVSARMSAWEQISSANVVSNIKKVNPGDCTPLKTCPKTPSQVESKSVKVVGDLGKPPIRATPVKVASASKSFHDDIKERVAKLNSQSTSDNTASETKTVCKGMNLTSTKSSPVVKFVQQHLNEDSQNKNQTSDKALRLREERMAELNAIQNRWKNGILKEDDTKSNLQELTKSPVKDKKEAIREKAREDFEKKLSSMGFEVANDDKASFKKNPQPADTKLEPSTKPYPPPPPPIPNSAQKVDSSSGKPQRPTSLFGIISQKKESMNKTPTPASGTNTCRKVKFDDSFESDDSEVCAAKKPTLSQSKEDTSTKPAKAVMVESDTTTDTSANVTEDTESSEFEVVLRRPRVGGNVPPCPHPPTDEDDDLSLSAFVPASVRRQSILPSPQQQHQRHNLDSSYDSFDSFEGAPGAPADIHKSTVNLVRLGQQEAIRDSTSSLTSTGSSSEATGVQPHSGYRPDDTEDSFDDRDAIGDLLEEAMDSDAEDRPQVSGKPPQPQKRRSHMMATQDNGKDDLPFSISSYRANRNSQIAEVKQTIVRNSQYSVLNIEEEDVRMPTHSATPASRQTIQERIKELQELIQQEQNVIMQTSNALNQCCSNSSYFAGSAEQVECNRLLLIACQKRQSYMTEIQRLKDTGCLESSGQGPRGSLTISDIRLPLKKDFVTKIGTSHDTTTYYFILLLRNGPQLLCTQMLSTHDPMMRGSLDFPNLIKINGITGSFKLTLEIYSMSVSREPAGKDKKKKTPKKMKGNNLTVQSPGGPMAVHTTSFTQMTTLLLTMKSLDRNCFQLERLPYLSPLHGTVYMNLKCLMEADVEERGFLTMFEDVSGLGSWHRRWCVLTGNKVQFWKYPDDENRKEAMGYIDLKRCITEKVGLIPRDVCARPHTFEMVTVRQPRKGERDTLVSKTYNTTTTLRHMLSADTKEERIVWCNKINKALVNIRTWHSDALRPIHK